MSMRISNLQYLAAYQQTIGSLLSERLEAVLMASEEVSLDYFTNCLAFLLLLPGSLEPTAYFFCSTTPPYSKAF